MLGVGGEGHGAGPGVRLLAATVVGARDRRRSSLGRSCGTSKELLVLRRSISFAAFVISTGVSSTSDTRLQIGI